MNVGAPHTILRPLFIDFKFLIYCQHLLSRYAIILLLHAQCVLTLTFGDFMHGVLYKTQSKDHPNICTHVYWWWLMRQPTPCMVYHNQPSPSFKLYGGQDED